MSYTLEVDRDRAMIEIVYHGLLTIAERGEAIREGSRLLSASQHRRVLVDLREATLAIEPTHVRVQLAHDMAHAPAVQGSRLAYLLNADQEANRIIENMASARHMAVARFLDRDAALAWLTNDPPDTAPSG